MSKRFIAVLFGALLALLAATLWVPKRDPLAEFWDAPGIATTGSGLASRAGYTWLWDDGVLRWDDDPNFGPPAAPTRPTGTTQGRRPPDGLRTRWPVVIVTHALILLIGGGLLAFTVRRDRRRRAETA